jgi:hypothetical protein
MEGLLPSFAACEQLDFFRCDNNQFTGAYFARFNGYKCMLRSTP